MDKFAERNKWKLLFVLYFCKTSSFQRILH
jgi:hypothetical protein